MVCTMPRLEMVQWLMQQFDRLEKKTILSDTGIILLELKRDFLGMLDQNGTAVRFLGVQQCIHSHSSFYQQQHGCRRHSFSSSKRLAGILYDKDIHAKLVSRTSVNTLAVPLQ